jgi:hypothetical protein
MITFACPACGHVHQRPDSAGGQKLRCENPLRCPAKIRVPVVDVLATPPPRPSIIPSPPVVIPDARDADRPIGETLVRHRQQHVRTAPPTPLPDTDLDFDPPTRPPTPNPERFPALLGDQPDWYYEHDGRPCGPVAAEHLEGLAADGTIRPDGLVWTAGAAGWVPAGRVFPDLFPRGRRPRPPAWQRAVAAGLALAAAVTALTFVFVAARRAGPATAPGVAPATPPARG